MLCSDTSFHRVGASSNYSAGRHRAASLRSLRSILQIYRPRKELHTTGGLAVLHLAACPAPIAELHLARSFDRPSSCANGLDRLPALTARPRLSRISTAHKIFAQMVKQAPSSYVRKI